MCDDHECVATIVTSKFTLPSTILMCEQCPSIKDSWSKSMYCAKYHYFASAHFFNHIFQENQLNWTINSPGIYSKARIHVPEYTWQVSNHLTHWKIKKVKQICLIYHLFWDNFTYSRGKNYSTMKQRAIIVFFSCLFTSLINIWYNFN